jgi:hypothetical protein
MMTASGAAGNAYIVQTAPSELGPWRDLVPMVQLDAAGSARVALSSPLLEGNYIRLLGVTNPSDVGPAGKIAPAEPCFHSLPTSGTWGSSLALKGDNLAGQWSGACLCTSPLLLESVAVASAGSSLLILELPRRPVGIAEGRSTPVTIVLTNPAYVYGAVTRFTMFLR